MSYYRLISLMPKTAPFSFLLDTYSGAAAAYSLRRLSSTYTGSAIRVRRSSDNAEQDFGFVNNVLDTAALLTFCGSGSGFVTTWYDQSGNARNAIQTTATSQPRIVNAGVVELQNSKPTLRWHSNIVRFSSYKFAAPSTNWNIINITSINNVSGGNNNVFGSDGNGFNSNGIYVQNNTLTANRVGGLSFTTIGTITNNTQFFVSHQYLSNNTAQSFVNADVSTVKSMLISGNTFTTGTQSVYSIGAYYDPAIGFRTDFNLLGSMSEHTIYQSDETSNMTGIKSNINSFYGIY